MAKALSSLELSEAAATELVAVAGHLGWDDMPSHTVIGALADHELGARLRGLLMDTGSVVVRLPKARDATQTETPSVIAAVSCTIATPIRVFQQVPGLWRRLTVDTSRPEHRSGGTGAQPLHIDFVNAADPPEFVYLYCERPDPRGGGASLIASTVGLERELSSEACAVLRNRVFRDGVVENLAHVGGDTNPFAVFTTDFLGVRYTAKLLESTKDSGALAALELLRDLLNIRTIEVMLGPGDLLIIDQRIAVHGRAPLGPNQDTVPSADRRLLMHGFGRSRSVPPEGTGQ